MWSKIRALREKQNKEFLAGASKWTDPALASRVLAMLNEKSEPAIDLDLEVPAAALTGSGYWFEYYKREKTRWRHWIERWTNHDLASAVRALAACVTWRAETPDDAIHLASCSLEEGIGLMGPEPFYFLREAIAKAKPTSYAAAKLEAASIVRNTEPALRLALAYAFPKESFAESDRAWAFSVDAEDAECAAAYFYALAFVRDESILAPSISESSTWRAWTKLAENVNDIAKLDEPTALAILRLMLASYDWRGRETASALVSREANAASIPIAVEFLESHGAGAALRPFVAQSPAIAIAALADRIESVRKDNPRAKLIATSSLLTSLVLANRGIAEKLPKRDVLERALDDTKPLPDAAIDDLPPALASPPWRAVAKTKEKDPKAEAPIAFDVKMLPYEENVVWGDQSAKEISEAAFPAYEKPRTAKRDASVLKKLKPATKKGDFTGIFELGELTDAAALKVIRTWSPNEFYFDEEDVIGIVARHGLEALDESIRYAATKPSTASALSIVDSPRVAELMAHLAVNLKKAKASGEAWFAAFPASAAIGLIAELGKKSGKDRQVIEEAIRIVARNAPHVVNETAKRYGKNAERAVNAVLATSTFAAVPKKLPKMPKFWNAKGLPRPRIASGKESLSLESMEDLGVYLALSKRAAYHPALFAIRDACDRASLARFAWALFSEWLASGADTKFDFGFFVLGVFGDDDAAHALQPMIKAWAPGGFPTRAQLGVDVLAALGSHAALEEVYKTATKVRSRALAAHAEKTLEKIAARLRLSRDDLADRLVPDLDVDAKGTRTFDFGKRKFIVRFDEQLKPTPENLPKPNTSDDEELANDAVNQFKEMKKRAREVFREQSRRLEQTLANRRKYDANTFAERFVNHPILHMLGERLVWGAYTDNKLRAAFRIDERSYVDLDTRPFKLKDGDVIGLVHPIELDEKSRARWSTALAELHFIQPITQLGRDVHDRKSVKAVFEQVKKKKIPTPRILGLERRFWTRDASGQGGVVSSYEKKLGADLRVTIEIDPGVYLGDPKEHPEQTIEAIAIARGKADASIDDLDAAIASEIGADIASLFAD